MWFWLKISICQSSMVHRECWVNCPTRVVNLEASTVCWRESSRQVQLCGNQAAADHIQHVAVGDLVLSLEDKPKRHRSAREIAYETAIPVYTGKYSRRSRAHMLQTTSCSTVVWSQSYLPSHSLINNLIVCNKSCYCYIINSKLNNK